MKAHRLLYDSTLGLRVIKKKKTGAEHAAGIDVRESNESFGAHAIRPLRIRLHPRDSGLFQTPHVSSPLSTWFFTRGGVSFFVY